MSNPAEAPTLPKYEAAVGKRFLRSLAIDETRKIDEEARTVELSFASETPYMRWYGYEIVDMKTMNLERLKAAAPVLVDHDGDQIGVVERCWIEGQKAHALLRFSDNPRGAEVFRDIVNRIRRNVSFGYMVDKMNLEKEDGDVRTYRAETTPYEISIVGMPADFTVGVGRGLIVADEAPTPAKTEPIAKKATGVEPENAAHADQPQNRSVTMPEGTQTGLSPDEVQRQLDAARNETSAAAAQRAAEMTQIALKHMEQVPNALDLAAKAIGDPEVEVIEFKCQILEAQGKAAPVTTDPSIGMDDKEVRKYSITKAIREMASRKGLTGLEREAHETVQKNVRRDPQGAGFFVPYDVESRREAVSDASLDMVRRLIRTLEATIASTGGYTVGTDVLGGSMIELLRNRMLINQLGARMLSGLQGDLAIPKATGGAVAYWLDEGEPVTPTDQAFGQVGLKPKRVAGATAFTRQLLAQSSIDVEAFVRSDLMQVLALAKDLACIAGTGGKQPKGILHTNGINEVTFNGAPTWASVVEFETKVEEDNALINPATSHYLTTPGVKGKWKTTSKVSNEAVFLWESGNQVNGYGAASTNQVPNNRTIFGDFSQLVVGDWNGLEVLVNPYSEDLSGKVRVTVQHLTDMAVRHPESFCASTDAGNQGS